MSEEKTNDEKIDAIDPDNNSSLSNSDSLQEHQEEQADIAQDKFDAQEKQSENTTTNKSNEVKKVRVDSKQLEKLTEIKKQQAKLDISEANEMDRLARQQRQMVQEKNDKLAYMIEIKKEHIRNARQEAELMNRLAKKQLQEIERRNAETAKQTAELNQATTEASSEELQKLERIKQRQEQLDASEAAEMDMLAEQQREIMLKRRAQQERLDKIKEEQARIAAEEAEQMNKLAQQQRENKEKNREELELKRQQKAYAMQLEQAVHEQRINDHYEDNALHHEYNDDIFTPVQVERFFKTYNSVFLGLLFSCSLIMYMFAGMKIIMVAGTLSFGLFVLMVLNRKIINFILSAIAVTIYGYIGWMEHEALDADVLLSAFNFIVQPIGFIVWYRAIKSQQRMLSMTNPEVMKQSVFDFRVQVRRLPSDYVKYWVLITMAIATMWYAVLSLDEVYITYNNEHIGVSYLDVITNTLSVLGQIFLILRYREQWFVWILVNLLHAFVWYSSMTPVGAFQWILFFINACVALYIWSKESHNDDSEENRQELSEEEALIKKLQSRSE